MTPEEQAEARKMVGLAFIGDIEGIKKFLEAKKQETVMDIKWTPELIEACRNKARKIYGMMNRDVQDAITKSGAPVQYLTERGKWSDVMSKQRDFSYTVVLRIPEEFLATLEKPALEKLLNSMGETRGKYITTHMETWYSIRMQAFNNKIVQVKNLLKQSVNYTGMLKELFTLNLDFGRQTGKSYFATQLSKRLEELTINHLVVFGHMRQMTQSKINNLFKLQYNQCNYRNFVPSASFDIIMISDSASFTRNELDTIYDNAERLKCKLVILL